MIEVYVRIGKEFDALGEENLHGIAGIQGKSGGGIGPGHAKNLKMREFVGISCKMKELERLMKNIYKKSIIF